jgi:hypothetical protein
MSDASADLAAEQARTTQATVAFEALARRLEAMADERAIKPWWQRLLREGRMKPVNLAAKLAAAETELACVKMVLAQVKLDRDELRQERDDWRREAEMLCAEKQSGRPDGVARQSRLRWASIGCRSVFQGGGHVLCVEDASDCPYCVCIDRCGSVANIGAFRFSVHLQRDGCRRRMRQRNQHPGRFRDFRFQRLSWRRQLRWRLPGDLAGPGGGERKIDFSFSWHTLSPGVDTPEQTVFFVTPGGLVADVLDYASSVFGGAGRDFMIISGYVLPFATPVTVADLASQGITSTGSVSLPVLYEFPTTDLTATFQPAPIPELPTWGLIGLGFAGLGLSGSFIAGKRAAVAA